MLSASQPPLASVMRVPELDRARFEREFLATGTPVVVEHALDRWPLLHFTPRQLRDVIGEDVARMRSGDYVTSAFLSSRSAQQRITFAAYLDELERGASDDELPAYLGNAPVPEALMASLELPPLFESEQLPMEQRRLWLGPRGTVTSLHRDGIDNLFAQVWGQKRFLIAAPHERPRLSCWAATRGGAIEASEVDPEHIDTASFPEAASVRFIEVVLGPSDVFFLPEGWFHHVRSLSTSLSVNFWSTTRRLP